MKKSKIIISLLFTPLVMTSCGQPSLPFSLNTYSIRLIKGENYQIDYEGKASFYSLDNNIVTVDDKGLVTAVAQGETSIVVSSQDKIYQIAIVVKNDETLNEKYRTGNLKINLDAGSLLSIFGLSGGTFSAPFEFSYGERNSAIDIKNFQCDLKMNITDPKATETITAEKQKQNNINFLKTIFTFPAIMGDLPTDFCLYGNYLQNNYHDEDITFDLNYQDKLDISIYQQEDQYGLFYEKEKEEKGNIFSSILYFLSNADFSFDQILEFDFIKMFNSVFEGDYVFLDDNNRKEVTKYKPLLNVAGMLMDGLVLKKTMIDDRNTKLDFSINEKGRKQISSLLSSFIPVDFQAILKSVSVPSLQASLTLEEDETTFKTHLKEFSFKTGLEIENTPLINLDINIDLDTTINEGKNQIQSGKTTNQILKEKKNKLKPVLDVIAPFLTFSNNPNNKYSMPLTSGAKDKISKAISDYKSLPEELKTLLDGAYDEENILPTYEKVTSKIKDSFALLSNSSTLDEILSCINEYLEYTDLANFFKEDNKAIYNHFLALMEEKYTTIRNELINLQEEQNKLDDSFSSIFEHINDATSTLITLDNEQYLSNVYIPEKFIDTELEIRSSLLKDIETYQKKNVILMKNAIEKNLKSSTDKATFLSYLEGVTKMLYGFENGSFGEKNMLSYYKDNLIDENLYKSVANRLIENQIYPELLNAYVEMKNSPDDENKSTIYTTKKNEAKSFAKSCEEFENDSYGKAISSYKSLLLFIDTAK